MKVKRKSDYAGGWVSASIGGALATIGAASASAAIASGDPLGGLLFGLTVSFYSVPVWILGVGLIGLPLWFGFEHLGWDSLPAATMLGAIIVGFIWLYFGFDPSAQLDISDQGFRQMLGFAVGGALAGGVSGACGWWEGRRDRTTDVLT